MLQSFASIFTLSLSVLKKRANNGRIHQSGETTARLKDLSQDIVGVLSLLSIFDHGCNLGNLLL
jgi:hypothetical protein